MEAEMLRREFREASLLANGGGGGGVGGGQAVLEPSSQTQVDLTATADRRPVAAAAAATVSRQLQQSTAADHSSDGSSSVDSRRVVDMAYAYGNQSEYTAGHCAKSGAAPQTVKPTSTVNNNDDEYLVEQRLLGHGTDVGGAEAVGSPPLPSPPPLPAPQPPSRSGDICSAEDRTVAT